jgi:hypothetical protein
MASTTTPAADVDVHGLRGSERAVQVDVPQRPALSICTTCVGEGCTRCEGRGTVHPKVQALIDAAPPISPRIVAELRPIFAPAVALVLEREKHDGGSAA